MSPEVVERAFEPFFTTKLNGAGSGLGLATVYGIVTQSGGDTYIESFPLGGTTFSALFPASQAAAGTAEATPELLTPRGIETILVVEDEQAVRELTHRILVRHGYHVITARHGAEALALAKSHQGPIDLLLTDVVMPQMLGHEVAQRFVELRPGAKVLYMSGYAQPSVDARVSHRSGGTRPKAVHRADGVDEGATDARRDRGLTRTINVCTTAIIFG